ncbi:MAG TPA: hypothetical protein VFN35_33430, partial [Ktedonobacteraceae bacterium]|nr:hypothetical protein [Ktedonobacteraceae bacterium]
MTFTRHPLQREVDIYRVLDLVRSMPLSSCHMLDLPWRLSSPAIAAGQDAVFWENTQGQVIGFAAWQ